jgi:hypothetical protein
VWFKERAIGTTALFVIVIVGIVIAVPTALVLSSLTGTEIQTPANILESHHYVGTLDTTPIDDIESSLVLVASDELGDNTDPQGGAPPEGVHNYPPVDIDKLYMGVSGERLYIKWTINGTIPTERENVDNNTIESLSYNLLIDNDENTFDGWNGAEAHLQLVITYDDDGDIWISPSYRAKFLGWDQGYEGHFEAQGENNTIHSSDGILGDNYFIISYSLDDLLGTVYADQTINLQLWSEANSDLYHHFAFDTYPTAEERYVSVTVQEI